MKVLVTGGTGVVGPATVRALLAHGHSVRLASRSAPERAGDWEGDVEAIVANVGEDGGVDGIADGCDGVIHITGIMVEDPPETTYESINIEGTRRMLAEAARANVRRFLFLSSLGADRGESEYHRSKRAAERLVEAYAGDWTIVRLANVYGPGDSVISELLALVRRLPAIPVIGGGDHPFEPIWHEDAGEALARVVERDDLGGRTLDAAGAERTSLDDLLDRFATITGRDPARIPLPARLARMGASLASALGMDIPVTASQVTMLEEGNVVRAPEGNALESVLGMTPTPLDEGLRMLADVQLEQLPDEGVGPLRRKRFYADIRNARLSAAQLCAQFRDQFADILPLEVGAEPGANTVIEEGATITMKLPVRGVVQVRCEEAGDSCVTLATLKGHPLAGMVRFLFEQHGPADVHAEIRVYARAGGLFDHIALSTIGTALQNEAWKTTLERVVELSGGEAPDGIQHESSKLDEHEDDMVQEWMESMVQERRRRESA